MQRDEFKPNACQPTEVAALGSYKGKRDILPPLADQEEDIGHTGMFLSKIALLLRDSRKG